LSGGQSDEDATAHLDEMNKLGPHPWKRATVRERELPRMRTEMNKLGPHPWKLTFSYGRALQHAALHAWAGKNADAGKKAHLHRAKMNGLAALGKWSVNLEKAA